MNTPEIRSQLARYISDTFVKGRGTVMPANDQSFLESEIIDSTGVLELVLFIEETFGFRVEDEEIIPENLDSMNRLVAYVEFKKKSAVPRV